MPVDSSKDYRVALRAAGQESFENAPYGLGELADARWCPTPPGSPIAIDRAIPNVYLADWRLSRARMGSRGLAEKWPGG